MLYSLFPCLLFELLITEKNGEAAIVKIHPCKIRAQFTSFLNKQHLLVYQWQVPSILICVKHFTYILNVPETGREFLSSDEF